MKSTLEMLAIVAAVAVLTAVAVLLSDRHSHVYLIGVALVGGLALAYAGWRWRNGRGRYQRHRER
jgi:hypothetical protein